MASKEEPAWRAELRTELRMAMLGYSDPFTVAAAHVYAAEQRGFQAGVNKTGDSVGKLRAELKTARASAFREVADHLESIDPIEFALGTVDAVREALRMAKEAESQ
jgi:hypothetical protein